MNLELLHFSHITNFILSLTKKNINSCLEEILEFIEELGEKATLQVFQLLLLQFDWNTQNTNKENSLVCRENSPGITAELLRKLLPSVPVSQLVPKLSEAIVHAPVIKKWCESYVPVKSSSSIKTRGSALSLLLSHYFKLGSRLLECCVLAHVLHHTATLKASPLTEESLQHLRTEAALLLANKLPVLASSSIQQQIGSGSFVEDQSWLLILHGLITVVCTDCVSIKEAASSTLAPLPHLSSVGTAAAAYTGASPSRLSPVASHSPAACPSFFQIPSDICKNFLSFLQKEFPPSSVPALLAPLLYPEVTLKQSVSLSVEHPTISDMGENVLADLFSEVGANNCSTIEECRNCLAQIPKAAVTSTTVARLIISILRSHHTTRQQSVDQIGIQSLNNSASLWTENKDKSGSRTDGSAVGAVTWNMESIIQAIMEFSPAPLSCKDVLLKLDTKGFIVADRIGLSMFVTATRILSNLRNDQYPIDCIYRKWQNSDEQVLLISTMLNHPDIFCFFDYPCNTVSVEMLKSVPELDNKEVATWRSLNLLELLFSLESTHYSTLKNTFMIARQNCPDVLMLALVQSSTTGFTLMKQELLRQLVPVFLEPHPNTAAVLQAAWYSTANSATIKQVILVCMAEWYMQQENDQTRLSRILDVAQDLKALSLLLNAQPLPFVIDLACLAFRREFLKLDKWLTDKVRESGEVFISALVKFVQQRCPQLMGAAAEEASAATGLPKSSQLPIDTINTITTFLTPFTRTGLNHELSECIVAICQNSSALAANRQRSVTSMLGGYTPQDPLAGLTPGLSNLAIGGTGTGTAAPTASASTIFPLAAGAPNLPSNLAAAANLASTPGSPARGGPLGVVSVPQQQQGGTAGGASGPSLHQQQQPAPPPHQTAIGTQPAISGSSVDITAIFELPPTVSKEVEDEANSFFQRIYNNPSNSGLTIKEILDLLKKFHESSNKKEREVYSCMLRNLFEEYKFFPTYPTKELFTTAKLFGGIIDQGLVEYMALGVALRYVMEALQKTHGSKMYFFGVLALDRFKGRLKEYPRYCHHIMAIEHFTLFPPHLAEWVRYGGQHIEPPTKPTGSVLPPDIEHFEFSQQPANTPAPVVAFQRPNMLPPPPPQGTPGKHPGSVAPPTAVNLSRAPAATAKPSITTTNIETLLVASEDKQLTIVQPNEKQNDKIAFIFNNLSQVNLQQKCDELLEVVPEECWSWVAQYLVMKRASIEANFHNLYSNFLDQLKNGPFTQKVIDETLRNIKVLLKLEKSSANFSDKSLLKNLGHWLGLLTLAKSKPILHSDINVKSLLIEAFIKGTQEMQYVVPFVTKVMESCGKSRIFKPPNPWTMAILNVLAEIRAMHHMKLHLKFEIEVLCNKLNISIEDLSPGTVLQEATANTVKEFQLSQTTNFITPNVTATTTTDVMNDAMVAAFGRAKRADSTPLLSAMPNFQNQTAFLAGAGSVSVSEGVGVSGQGSSSAGATPTPQVPMPQQQPSHTPAHLPADHHLHAAAAAAAAVAAARQAASIGSTSNAGTPTLGALFNSTERTFSYNDINVSTLRALDQHISLNNIPILAELNNQTQLKNLIRAAIELAVQEVLQVVMERSVRIAISTMETLVKKDFALDPDENHIRGSAHHMVRNLTASMAMITCKDYLVSTIAKSIKQKINPSVLRNYIPVPEQQMEQIYTAIAQENMAFTCNFIQKTCAEKAVIEADKRLAAEFEARKNARAENRHYCDTGALTYQAERMPDQIRLKVGRVTHQQLQIYEDFGRQIPGFAPTQDLESNSALIAKNAGGILNNDDQSTFQVLTERFIPELEAASHAFNAISLESFAQIINGVLNILLHIRNNRDFNSIPVLLKKCTENLFEGSRELPTEAEFNNLAVKFRDIHILLLKTLADQRICGPQWTTKLVTKCWFDLREDLKFNVDVFDWLLRSALVSLPLLDEHLSSSINDNRAASVYFTMQLVQVYLVEESNAGVISEGDLPLTLESLLRLCQLRQAPDTLLPLLESVRLKHEISQVAATASDRASVIGGGQNVVAVGGTAGPVAGQTASQQVASAAQAVAAAVSGQQSGGNASSVHFHSGVNQARDFSDPPGLQEKTEVLLREWIALYHSPSAGPGSSTAFTHFVKQMNLHGILKTDELITRFFRNCVSYCREICIRSLNDQNHTPAAGAHLPVNTVSAISMSQYRNKCFQHIDPFVRLLALLIKHSGEANNPSTKINLLNKVLGLVCGIMMHDIETNATEFYQLPYHRIFIMLFLELNAPEPVVESINLNILIAFTQVLHLLRPSKCSGFAYAWLEIVSHRVFIGRMLAVTPQQKGWAMYSMLLTDLFKFLAPFLRNAELAPPLLKLYRGTLRVLLVLLHDFPEFLCEYHYGFCDAIPPNCIQMRNLILSAFPRNMRLPDPFTPNLKVDMLPEIGVSPKINTQIANCITPLELRNNLDSYLKNRTPVTFLTELRGYLQTPSNPTSNAPSEDGMHYNTGLLNALVVYVGMQAIAHIQSKGQTPSMSTIAHSAHMDIFQNLAVDMDTEGRYLFLNAIANQLRYPNSHTHYFSCTLLYLFVEANTEAMQEQITRVLLERLIVNRPHPWGLLITFIELIKNPTYNFWSHEFVKCAPEIEKLFESVARSCMVNKVQRDGEP